MLMTGQNSAGDILMYFYERQFVSVDLYVPEGD